MKTLLISLFMVSLSMSAWAEDTHDGDYVSDQQACEALLGPDVTKGLYGLCVAYTAVDIDQLMPIEERGAARNAKILEMYNKRKSEDDPVMPGTEPVEASCPCWTADEILTIDGYGNETGVFFADGGIVCDDSETDGGWLEGGTTLVGLYEVEEFPGIGDLLETTAYFSPSLGGGSHSCYWRERFVNLETVTRYIEISDPDEGAACIADARNRIAELQPLQCREVPEV